MKNQEILDAVYKYQFDDTIQKLFRKFQALKFYLLFLDMFINVTQIEY